MSKKFTQSEVEKIFQDGNCKCLGEYISANTPIKYQCECGNISKIKLSHFKDGHRCKKCGSKKQKEKRKHTQGYIEQYYKDQGCIFLDTYINAKTKYKYKCECGNIAYITFHDFQSGQ